MVRHEYCSSSISLKLQRRRERKKTQTQHNIKFSYLGFHSLSLCRSARINFYFCGRKRRSVINMAYLPRAKRTNDWGRTPHIRDSIPAEFSLYGGSRIFQKHSVATYEEQVIYLAVCITWAIFFPSQCQNISWNCVRLRSFYIQMATPTSSITFRTKIYGVVT